MHYDVVIVDSETMLANMTAKYFNAFDVKTAAMATAEECLEFLKENEIDLVILDINLVGSSGYDLCKVIRKDYNIPIFFISAKMATESMITALNLGSDDYITKPYELNVLLAKIKARGKGNDTGRTDWIFCPACKSKTRIKIREDTVLENFPLFCPKCKQEKLINVKQLHMSVITEPDAMTQSR